jgi:hypothetical protein
LKKLTLLLVLTALTGCGQANQSPPGASANSSPKAEESRKNEAQAKGKPTSYWIAQLRDKDPKTRAEAAEALQQIGGDGKEAVPELKVALKERVWEIFVSGAETNAENTFRTVGTKVKGPEAKPDKDEQIEQLQRQAKLKDEEIQRLHAELRQKDERFSQDACLLALVHALEKIDPAELERMTANAASAGERAKATFQKVADQIGSSSPPGK